MTINDIKTQMLFVKREKFQKFTRYGYEFTYSFQGLTRTGRVWSDFTPYDQLGAEEQAFLFCQMTQEVAESFAEALGITDEPEVPVVDPPDPNAPADGAEVV